MFFVEFNLVLVIIVHVVYSVCLVYSTVNADIVSFVDIVSLVDNVIRGYNVDFVNIVVSGYNVTHVYKALVNTTTLAPCVYIVAIGLIPYN